QYKRTTNVTKLILTLNDIVFIDTQVSKKKLNDESIMRSLLEIKTPLRSIARSYILTTPESSNIGILEGDWVWLKKIPFEKTTTSVTQNTQNLFSQYRQVWLEGVAVAAWRSKMSRHGHTFGFNFHIHRLICTKFNVIDPSPVPNRDLMTYLVGVA
ncbi:hypothetical protein ATANTOWER_014502, partial [Ataeniobius toweri]|nr:hypothetical protein [Ataeniobius toweri]